MNEIIERLRSSDSLTNKDEQYSLTESDYFRNSLTSVAHNPILMNLPHFNKQDYEFVKQVGCGSIGKVYRVIKIETSKEYAIKSFDKRILFQFNKVNSVLIEYDLLNKLEHPSIIKTYGLYEDEEKLYLVVDICTNRDLETFFTNNSPLNLSIIKYLTLHIVKALEYLHIKKIIHRDLKPSNFLLDEFYNIVLV
jgi:3-phosphoinositide dependent protein kinase-1